LTPCHNSSGMMNARQTPSAIMNAALSSISSFDDLLQNTRGFAVSVHCPLLKHRYQQETMYKEGQECGPKGSPAAVDAAPSVVALCAFGAAELVPNVVTAGARARECESVWACKQAFELHVCVCPRLPDSRASMRCWQHGMGCNALCNIPAQVSCCSTMPQGADPIPQGPAPPVKISTQPPAHHPHTCKSHTSSSKCTSSPPLCTACCRQQAQCWQEVGGWE